MKYNECIKRGEVQVRRDIHLNKKFINIYSNFNIVSLKIKNISKYLVFVYSYLPKFSVCTNLSTYTNLFISNVDM